MFFPKITLLGKWVLQLLSQTWGWTGCWNIHNTISNTWSQKTMNSNSRNKADKVEQQLWANGIRKVEIRCIFHIKWANGPFLLAYTANFLVKENGKFLFSVIGSSPNKTFDNICQLGKRKKSYMHITWIQIFCG